ncbi:hypothetical protein KR222_007853, partial [Zaprionus bogoriensis]
SYSDYYYNNASAKLLRFHDFEPRQQIARMAQPETGEEEARREARGFHFNALGGDVNVELEFIVPFVRIPVRRSMKLARDAVQNLLNLHTGALLNTAVIVAAGAVIATIVRLVLAPMVFTSMVANGYGGYLGKHTLDEALTQVLESQLDEHNIDVAVCAQRAICQYLQHNAAQLQRQPSSNNSVRIIHVLANSRWTDSLLNGTAVFNAIDAARSSRSCLHAYRSCSWPRLSHGGVWQRAWPNLLQLLGG